MILPIDFRLAGTYCAAVLAFVKQFMVAVLISDLHVIRIIAGFSTVLLICEALGFDTKLGHGLAGRTGLRWFGH